MTIPEYLAQQEPERSKLLASIHQLILKTNKKVTAEVSRAMGGEMIQYKAGNQFVYGLANRKNCISLHAMPIYVDKPIYEKYSKLLNKAKFQKGCINFKKANEMPLDITEQFLTDCAKIDWVAVMEKNKKK